MVKEVKGYNSKGYLITLWSYFWRIIYALDIVLIADTTFPKEQKQNGENEKSFSTKMTMLIRKCWLIEPSKAPNFNQREGELKRSFFAWISINNNKN